MKLLDRIRSFFDLAGQAARYKTSEAFRQAAFESAFNSIITINAEGVILEWNNAAEQLFGWSAEKAVGRRLEKLIIPERFRSAHAEGMRVFLSTGKSRILNRRVETTARGISGNEFPVELSITDFEIFGQVYFTANVRDITRRKNEEAHRQLLLNELNHRVTTTLRITQSFVKQMGRVDGGSWEKRYGECLERISSLTRIDQMLTRTDWRNADLRGLIVVVTATLFPSAQSRILLQGEGRSLPPNVAVCLAIIVHELTINSMRWGALSTDDGHLLVQWDLREIDGVKHFWWQWREIGGPESFEPLDEGFGLKMIRATVPREMHGNVNIKWPADGMICTICVPESQILLGAL